MNWNKDNLRNFVSSFSPWGKYVVVLLVFVLVYLFLGEQSLVNMAKRKARINKTEHQLSLRQEQIKQCRRDILTLENTDSLERYAREHYYMHADNEDVYLIE